MNTQSVVSRLHINRDSNVPLPGQKGEHVQGFVFAFGDRHMGV
jgi:hypothetical protein